MIVANVECHYLQAKVDNETFSLGDFACLMVKRASLSLIIVFFASVSLGYFSFLNWIRYFFPSRALGFLECCALVKWRYIANQTSVSIIVPDSLH